MAPPIINDDAIQGDLSPRTNLCIWRLCTAGQFAWPSGADRKLCPWPSGQIWKFELYGPHPRRLDLRWIRATAERDVGFRVPADP